MENWKVNVYSSEDKFLVDSVNLPEIFLSPIRIDIFKFVFLNMSKNKRQSYSVNQSSGMNTSAISWGTGRAVARIPRVKGSGTNRSGQGAVGNFCRGGRMFSPTTIWRKWHHKIIKNQRRQAVLTSVACSGLVSLVMARGHKISETPEIPLVIESCVESIICTKFGQTALKNLGAYSDIRDKLKKKTLKAGKGKLRNRRRKKYLGPLIIFEKNARAFRNIPGIETCCIDYLNIQKLAPGGHVGRFCIWTYKSFSKLDQIYYQGNLNSFSKNEKKKENNLMTNSNLKVVINSNRIQNDINPPSKKIKNFVGRKI
ncbi:rpl1 (nucleomorph) [Hemiselmis andersenii]|uniref:Rpl1 n=2 Tax=Hemiselmis andersenii TaxID=464988 RepID=A9BL16_HEMAN|nr:rpl1 [Hemiselmis andersenii]ABW98199.1 rpl1 [Hemiselmis andersenii]